MKQYTIELKNGRYLTLVDIIAEDEHEAIKQAKEQYGLEIYAVRGGHEITKRKPTYRERLER